MGLFDSLISNALKGVLSQGDSSLLPGLLSQILGKTDLGSIGGLLNQLQQGGLGGEVGSWLSSGRNEPVSPGQLSSALGGNVLAQIAQASGLSIDQLLPMLSQHLPAAVDQMSPNGELEEDVAPGGQGSLSDQAGLGDIKA